MSNKRCPGTKIRVRSGSKSHIARSVIIFAVTGVAFGLISCYGEHGTHHNQTTLIIAIVGGAVVAVGNYLPSRARQAGRDPIYNAGRALRDRHEDQLGQGGRPLSPGEAPNVG